MKTVFVGLTTIDHTQHVDRLPGVDEKIVARRSRLDVGGPAANAARTAHALGCQVTLVTALGQGPLANLARGILKNIEVIDVAPAEHEPPISCVLVEPDGRRAVVSTNATRLVAPQPPNPAIGEDAAVMLHDGHLLTASSVFTTLTGPTQLLDGGSWKPGLEKLLPKIDVAVVSANFSFPNSAPSQSLNDLAATGINILARTDGGGPVEVRTKDGSSVLPVEQVETVDTNGAGDVLHGALAAHLAKGQDFVSAMRAAIQLATESTKYHGVLGWV